MEIQTSAQYKLIYPLKHFCDLLENNIREDSRGFSKYRPIGVSVGTLAHCNGSSIVRVGNSNVLCGIRAELAKPRITTPTIGYYVPNVDGSFVFPSMTNEQVDVLNCLLYELLHDSECINLNDLCISERKLVWVLYLDIILLEQDGSMLDAMLLACVCALQNLALPKVIYDEKAMKVDVNNKKKIKLQLQGMPVLSKFSVFNDLLLMDPTHYEENISTSSISCGMLGRSVTLLCKHGGDQIITKDEINKSLIHAMKRKHKVIGLIKSLDINNAE